MKICVAVAQYKAGDISNEVTTQGKATLDYSQQIQKIAV